MESLNQNDPVTTALKAQRIDDDLQDLHRQVNELKQTVIELKKERDSLMKWGIMSLGAAVLGMALYIWHLFTRNL